MLQGKYEVLKNEQIDGYIYEMVINCPEITLIALPGQFVHIKTGNSIKTLLRRPISISKLNKAEGRISLVYQVVGSGTELMRHIKAGEMVDMIGPIGNGFPVIKGKKCAVVGGGIGIAPLLELCANVEDCEAFLGYRSTPYKLDAFKSHTKAVHIATDDGICGHKGFVTELIESRIKDFDVVYTCGPKLLMSKIKAMCGREGVECYVSVEERMGCGIGACLVCACKAKGADGEWHYKKACVDGPVFRAEEVSFDD